MKNSHDDIEAAFEQKDEKSLLALLRKFGKAPPEFNHDVFLKGLKHKNSDIRELCVKHLGKFSDPKITTKLNSLFKTEKNTAIRREIVSSIGRQRSEKNIKILLQLSKDPDPKVVMQCIRALLYFKDESSVIKRLNQLKSHKNEVIHQVLESELSTKTNETKPIKLSDKEKYQNLVVQGDIRKVLANIPDGVIDLTFTSPPYYNARDYSIYKSYQDYLSFLENVIKEIHRVTSEGRFFVLNTSPVLLPRFSRAHASTRWAVPFDIHPKIIQAGFEFIDDIVWKKPDGSATNRNGGFFQHRKPLGYKPNPVVEYVMVYRKKTTKLIDWNMNQISDKIMKASKVKGENYDKTNLWEINPETSNKHPASFPENLVENVIKFYSYENDLVMDPFAGSGTVGKVSADNNRYSFLVDDKPEYIKAMKKRLDNLSFKFLSNNKIKDL
tara:strand:- start:1455 stop:2774 length:1320 start_codon:yes stop_codon:yes gene_type:complete